MININYFLRDYTESYSVEEMCSNVTDVEDPVVSEETINEYQQNTASTADTLHSHKDGTIHQSNPMMQMASPEEKMSPLAAKNTDNFAVPCTPMKRPKQTNGGGSATRLKVVTLVNPQLKMTDASATSTNSCASTPRKNINKLESNCLTSSKRGKFNFYIDLIDSMINQFINPTLFLIL